MNPVAGRPAPRSRSAPVDTKTSPGGRPQLFLVDGSNLAYRSYFALARTSLTTTKGEATSAVFGFANTLWLLSRDYCPRYMSVVFDTSRPTFRHEAYEAYKAHRQEMPQDLSSQFPRIHELVEVFPLPTCSVEGVEADDIMGAYAAQLAGPDLEVVLVSGDKDFCQLVNDDVRILNLGRGGTAKIEAHWLDRAGVVEKFGVPPEQVVDVLALMGDASDGVPGVPGIGEKTASALIQEFGSLERLLESLDQVKKKSVQEKLRTYADQARLSRDLVTIRTDIPLPCPLEELEVAPPGSELVTFFRDMEFTRLAREAEARIAAAEGVRTALEPAGASGAAREAEARIAEEAPAGEAPGPASAKATAEPLGLFDLPPAPEGKAPPWLQSVPPTDAHYVVVSDSASLEDLARRLASSPDGFALAASGSTADALRADLVGLSFGTRDKEAFYVPVAHAEGPNLSIEDIRRVLGPVLADPAVAKSGHNIKWDLEILRRHGLEVSGVAFDTMIASYLVEAERSHRLESLAHDRLALNLIPDSDLVGRAACQRPLAQVPVALLSRSVGERADAVHRLTRLFRAELSAQDLDSLFTDLEMPLLLILREMEERGVALDVPFLEAMSVRLGAEMKDLESRAHASCNETFNLNSPLQLGRVLFECLKLPRARKTKTGYSTDNDVLEGLATQHPLPKLVLEWRQLSKLKSTYVDALPRLIHPETGRLHTSFNQTVAATGRLSSSDPNLQNIPIRTALGRDVRRAFVAGDANAVLISADYSQIELRIMAHLSRDERLIDYFRRDVDVHKETAASIFAVAPEDVTRDQRGSAKTVNYAIMYGQGPVGLAQQIGVSREEAALFIAAYRAQYPGVAAFLERTIAEARRTGFVSTILKRRRHLPNLLSSNGRLRSEAERMATNTPIQGSAADMIKLAMIRVHRELRAHHPGARLLLQVHDELLLEAPAREAEAAAARVKTAMEEALPLDVPVHVDVGIGKDWASIH
jgi:DNA polymerase-1